MQSQFVWWPNEKALRCDGREVLVTIFFWDYEKREGKAWLGQQVVDVFMTDYTLCDLTIRPGQSGKSVS